MRRLIRYIILTVTVGFIFSSCISTEETNYLQDIETAYSFRAFEEYKLSNGDYVTCQITTGDKEFAGSFNGLISTGSQQKSFQIYENGKIILPYFGSIHIAGLTLQEAERKVQKEMQESIIDVQVHMSFSSNVFYILSEDKRGTFAVYKDNMTIYQALAISGQTTDKMDLSKVTVTRKRDNGTTEVKTFDLRSKDIIESEFYYVKPNDLIYFPTNKNSFFSISSIGQFSTAITVPLVFLIGVIAIDF